jgi:hypothetical protein
MQHRSTTIQDRGVIRGNFRHAAVYGGASARVRMISYFTLTTHARILPFMESRETKRHQMRDSSEAPGHIGRMLSYLFYLRMFGGFQFPVNLTVVLGLLTSPKFWGASRPARLLTASAILAGVATDYTFALSSARRSDLTPRLTAARLALTV